jgi:hypothetical protein
MENYMHLLRPTTHGQIFELWVAGKLQDKDFENALKIVENRVNFLYAMLPECEQWEVEAMYTEIEKYKNLYSQMLGSRKFVVQGQKANECLKLAEKNWHNAAMCESPDEQLIHLERCLGYACTAGIDPFEFIVSKVKESLTAAA